MKKLLILLVFISGCGSDQVAELVDTPRNHSMVSQSCILQDEAGIVSDFSIPIFLKYLKEHGYISNTLDALERIDNIGVCVVQKPEACRFAGYYRPPFSEDGVPARKNGCASPVFAWASIEWPPICDDLWYDEPHCKDKTKINEWRLTLMHEIFNMLVLKFVDPNIGGNLNYYEHPIYSVETMAKYEIMELAGWR